MKENLKSTNMPSTGLVIHELTLKCENLEKAKSLVTQPVAGLQVMRYKTTRMGG